MAVDPKRVAALYAQGETDSFGSAYMVAEGVVLTAAHVVTNAGLRNFDKVEVLPYGGTDWLPATVIWLDPDGHLDAALIHLDQPDKWKVTSAVRWGRLPGSKPVSAAAIGFPDSVQQPDGRPAHESVVGFITPPADSVTGILPLHAQTSVPRDVPAGSPWAGMSGAALIAGPYLVGILILDPGRYGNDRLLAITVAALLAADGFTSALGEPPDVADVGVTWRLQYGGTLEQSVVLRAPYRPIQLGYEVLEDPYRLLKPEHKVIDFCYRKNLVNELREWALDTDAPLAIKSITGGGGSGKTRLAAETCLAMAKDGWDAGFADFSAPGGDSLYALESPTFMVIDDADLHVGQAAGIVRATIYSRVPVRLILLARARTGWWESFHSKSEGNVIGCDKGNLALDSYTLNTTQRADLFRVAFKSFSTSLSRSPLVTPDLDLNDLAFGDPLIVQIAALIAVLDGTVNVDRAADETWRTIILRAAVDGEARRWVQMLAEQHPAWNERVLRRCVSTASLASPFANDPDDAAMLEQAAIKFLRTVTDLSDVDNHLLLTLSEWLRVLHTGPSYWNPLRPDPLADQLLADLDVLPNLAETIRDVAVELDDKDTITRLLTELTRAATASGGAAARALNRLLWP